jgi:acetoacetyl-CoA synthetase
MKESWPPNKILWRPSLRDIEEANLTRFMEKVRQDYFVPIPDYDALYAFSINHPEDFWQSVWSFCQVIGDPGSCVLKDGDQIEKAKFFPGARLNFAENLLRRRDEAIAITFYGEDKVRKTLTFEDLYTQTAKLADIFKRWGIQPGDRVVGYLPNLPETIIAHLAAASIGAIWSSCSPDFGVSGVVDRFGQIAPKVLIIADGYFYGGKTFDCLERLPALRKNLASIEKVIIVPYVNSVMDEENTWDRLLATSSATSLDFMQLPFNHPLVIMYSSGTTGVPKCIVHGAGGTLLQHLKEHQLHGNIKPGDQVFYYTTCGWMMWNWLVSALASEASLVLYDGSPTYPHPAILFDIADEVGITLFGTSAKYIDSLAKMGVASLKTHTLPALKMITSTGSPLAPESFDYVYRSIKKDVCLSSISGGTDIISCFMLGNPIGCVRRGEIQTRGLGLAVSVFDEQGHEVIGQKGEMVCLKPFPSQPLGFWNDEGGKKYHAAYFERFPNVWRHGDFVELMPQGGLIIYGRSDAVLNPGGVRIGTAEIYRQVDQIPEILESVVVGQNWQGDVRVILFVRLKEGIALTESLINKIKTEIRHNTTPRHVPAKILAVDDIPRTKNGKIAELAVRNLIHGEPVQNQESLANPEALKNFQDIPDLA